MNLKYLLAIFLFLCSCQSQNTGLVSKPKNQSNAASEKLFNSLCVNCHKCEESLIGPTLAGAKQRWESRALLYEYIRNPQAVIAKNEYAHNLANQYKPYIMTAFPNLTDEQIEAVLSYCD